MRYTAKILFILTAIFTIYSCTRDELSDNKIYDDGEMVECAVSFDVAQMGVGTENSGLESRSTSTSTDVDEYSIKNLWVIQFNSSNVVIAVRYISDVTDLSSVSLVPTSQQSTVYYIANTFNTNLPVFEGMTMDEVEALGKSLTTSEDAYTTDTSDESKYLIMNGEYLYKDGTTADGESPKVSLTRNVAKINISITNNADITITDIEAHSVPQKLNYISSSEDIYPTTSDFATINYDTYISYTSGETTTFYMPENKRGSVDDSITEKEKPLYATPNTTSIKVYTTYTDGDLTGSRVYTFYLGANLTNDFNICHNTEYTYKITFTESGNAETDSRIEEFAPVIDFTTSSSSNCYILNPGLLSDRVFYIPVVDRINTFWGGNGYENVPDNKIDENTALTCEIIWGDNYQGKFNNIGVESTTTTYNDKNAIKVTLPSDIPYGNVVVGVRRSNSSNYLWSWHLWITDYNPDETRTAIDGVYRYDVTGGEIHRYKDYDSATETTKIWDEGGTLEGKFIMDRNIGQINGDANYYDTNLYYQYGRKDPFPGYGAGYFPSGSEFKPTSNLVYSTEDYAESVYSPTSWFYIGGTDYDWCRDTDYNSTSYKWNDPKILYASDKVSKSIFDPSPLGWKLLEQYTIYDLISNIKYLAVGEYSYYIGDELVETYYFTGLRSSSGASLSTDTRGLFWHNHRNTTAAARAYKFNASTSVSGTSTISFGVWDTSYPAWGFAVRCVQE